MVQLLSDLIKEARPKQALKNLTIFAPLVFSGNLFLADKFATVFKCAIIFTLMTSSIYIFNDILDLIYDRFHPFKKNRPIAKGTLPVPVALFISIVGIFIALSLGYLQGFFFFLTLLAYLFLQLLYSLWLRNMAVVDILLIAGGFVLRVYAGAFALSIHMSAWFLLCVVSLALFLAAGKRRAELGVLTEKAPRSRKSLTAYSPELLDAYLAMFANSAWLSYALFSFFFPPPLIAKPPLFLADLPLTLAGINKWLMMTVPVDKPLLGTMILWGIMVVVIIYGVRP
jgi:4-hydroxybenzoate polyprenyltransferase